MSQLFKLKLFTLLCFFSFACDLPADSPEAAMFHFGQAIVEKNEGRIKDYSTPEYYLKLNKKVERDKITKAIHKIKSKNKLILEEEANYEGKIKYKMIYSVRGVTRNDITLGYITVQCVNVYNMENESRYRDCKMDNIQVEPIVFMLP